MKKLVFAIAVLGVSAVLLTGCQSNTASTGTSDQGSLSQAECAVLIGDFPTVQAFTDEAVSEADMNAIVTAGVNAPSAMNGQPWHFSVVTNPEVMQQIADGMSFGGPNMPDGAIPEGVPEMPEGTVPEGAPEMPEGTMPEGAPEMPEGTVPEGAPKMPEGAMPEGAPEMPEGAEGQAPAMPEGVSAGAGITDAPMLIVVSCKAGSELDAGLATQNMAAEAVLLGYGTKILSSPTMALNGEKQAEYKELLGIPEDMSAVCVLLVGVTDTENYDVVSGATERNPLEEMATFVK